MDVEQFKIIMQAVEHAGQGAFWIAILYIAQGLLKFVLGIGVGTVAIVAAYKLIRRATECCSLWGRVVTILKPVRDSASGWLSDSDIIGLINEWKEKYTNGK